MVLTSSFHPQGAARVVERVRDWEADLEREEKSRKWLARPRIERVFIRLVWAATLIGGTTAICTALFLLFPVPGESIAKLILRFMLSFGVFLGVGAGLGQLWDALREPR